MALFRPPDIEKLKRKGDVRGLLRATRHNDAEVRIEAVQALADGPPDAVEALIGRLEDEDDKVRGAAARSLGQMGDPRAVDPLVSAMKEGRESDLHIGSDPAASALLELNMPRGVRAVLRSAPRPPDRESAARALGEMGDTEAADLLAEAAAGNEQVRVREAAIQALADVEAPTARDLLFRLSLNEEDPGVCVAAVSGLHRLGDERARARAVELLKARIWEKTRSSWGESNAWQSDLVDVLRPPAGVRSDDPRTSEVLTELIAAPGCSAQVARALGEFGPPTPAAVESLGAALDKGGELAIAAARALGRLGDERAVKPLANIALVRGDRLLARAHEDWHKQRDFEAKMQEGGYVGARWSFEDLRFAAAAALEQIGGPEAHSAAAEFRADPNRWRSTDA